MIRGFHISILVLSGIFDCLAQIATPLAGVYSGRIDRYLQFPSNHIPPRNVDIWLPDDYNSKTKYAVLYMHDGQMLFDSTSTWNGQDWGLDETLSQLLHDKLIQPTIVVAIWNAGAARHSEYFPQKPFEFLEPAFRDSLLENGKRAGYPLFASKIYSDAYLKFIVEEVKPFMDTNYSTLPDADHTFIAGSSMGGLVSWYALCEYPNVFGGAACISTHWPGFFDPGPNPIPNVFVKYLEEKLPPPRSHIFYFDHGTATLDAQYEVTQKRVDDIFRRKDYTSSHWMSRRFEGEDHSERAWKKRLTIPLTFLLQNKP
ncbi:MAG: esterase [Saprospiraceae bacterium]|nr:esterase [Saprospiraceae bacterium]